MYKRIKVLLVLSIAILAMVFLFVSAVRAQSPTDDLSEALVYWQEQAVTLAQENAILKAENERLAKENENLQADINDAELLVVSLRSNLNNMAIEVEKMNSLRLQAENALSLANVTIKQLEDTIKKLSSARFGLLLGATYTSGSFRGMAGVTISF